MTKYLKHILIGMATGIANGFFGAGGGTIVVPAMEKILNIDEHQAHATAILIILPLTIMSSVLYITNKFVDWSIILRIIPGAILGGYIGAKLLNICPRNILKKAFGIFMIIAALRMVLG